MRPCPSGFDCEPTHPPADVSSNPPFKANTHQPADLFTPQWERRCQKRIFLTAESLTVVLCRNSLACAVMWCWVTITRDIRRSGAHTSMRTPINLSCPPQQAVWLSVGLLLKPRCFFFICQNECSNADVRFWSIRKKTISLSSWKLLLETTVCGWFLCHDITRECSAVESLLVCVCVCLQTEPWAAVVMTLECDWTQRHFYVGSLALNVHNHSSLGRRMLFI